MPERIPPPPPGFRMLDDVPPPPPGFRLLEDEPVALPKVVPGTERLGPLPGPAGGQGAPMQSVPVYPKAVESTVGMLGAAPFQMIEGTGGVLRAAGAEETGKAVADFGKKYGAPPKWFEELSQSPDKFYDPAYIAGLASQGAGSSLSFFLPGAGVGKVAAGVSKLPIGMWRNVAAWAAGTTTASVMESAVDAGSAYNDAIDKGVKPEVAANIFTETMKREVPTTVLTNAFGEFSPRLGKNVWQKALQMGLDAAMEGGEEVAQGAAQISAENAVLGTDKSMLEGAPEAFVGGALGGALMSGGRAVIDRAQPKPPPDADQMVDVPQLEAGQSPGKPQPGKPPRALLEKPAIAAEPVGGRQPEPDPFAPQNVEVDGQKMVLVRNEDGTYRGYNVSEGQALVPVQRKRGQENTAGVDVPIPQSGAPQARIEGREQKLLPGEVQKPEPRVFRSAEGLYFEEQPDGSYRGVQKPAPGKPPAGYLEAGPTFQMGPRTERGNRNKAGEQGPFQMPAREEVPPPPPGFTLVEPQSGSSEIPAPVATTQVDKPSTQVEEAEPPKSTPAAKLAENAEPADDTWASFADDLSQAGVSIPHMVNSFKKNYGLDLEREVREGRFSTGSMTVDQLKDLAVRYPHKGAKPAPRKRKKAEPEVPLEDQLAASLRARGIEVPAEPTASAQEEATEPRPQPSMDNAPTALPPQSNILGTLGTSTSEKSAKSESESTTTPGNSRIEPQVTAQPQATAEEPKQTAETKGVRGRSVTVAIPGEESSYEGEYEVRELADVQASHNPFSFEKNPGYAHANDRDYKDPQNAARVIEHSNPEKFNPDYVLSESPTAEHGAPVVDERGNALGGNNRTMTIARVYQNSPEAAKRYRDQLEQKAAQFGVDSEAVRGMRQPVLVRRVKATDPQKAITDFNKKGSASLRPSEQAVTDGKRMSGRTVETLVSRIEDNGEGANLADALRGDDAVEVVDALIKDGVFTEQEKAGMLDERGHLTPEVKARVGKALVGRLFPDAASLNRVKPEMRGKLERVAPHVLRVEGREEWKIAEPLAEAMALLEDAAAHASRNLDDTARQTNIEGQRYSKEAVALAKILRQSPNKAAAAFRRYANDEALSRDGAQAAFFEPPTRAEAFDDAFGEPEKTGFDRDAEAARERLRPVFSGGTLASGINADVMKDLAVVVAHDIKRGYANFKAFRDRMIRAAGDAIKPHIMTVWARAKSLHAKYKASKWASERGSLPAGKSPAFYSQLERTVAEKMPAKASTAQVRAMLSNPQNGVKPDEVKWTALDEFLVGRESVTKAEVQQHLADSAVQVVEKQESSPKYEKYTLPGGENYRELLFTLPEKPVTDLSKAWREKREGKTQRPFESSHWVEKNVLAHVRFNERTDSDGNPVLHVEEIQSDWHQAGRRKGYREPIEVSIRETDDQYIATSPGRREIAIGKGTVESESDARRYARMMYEDSKSEKEKVPAAPFAKTWHELVFRRMARWAAENGFDRVTWVTGEQAAERFDLSKQVNWLYWKDGDLRAKDHSGKQVIHQEGVSREDLPDYVGKEVAQRLLSASDGKGAYVLSGQDLKIGGEGMRGFYDDILPKYAAKFGKKFGATVDDVAVSVGTTERDPESSEIAKVEQQASADVRDWYELKSDYGIEDDGTMYWMGQGDSVFTDARAVGIDRDLIEYAMDGDDPSFEDMRAKLERRLTAKFREFREERLKAYRVEQEVEYVHSLPITPAMRESVMRGQPLFMRRTAGRLARWLTWKPYRPGMKTAELAKAAQMRVRRVEGRDVFLGNMHAVDLMVRMVYDTQEDASELGGVRMEPFAVKEAAKRWDGMRKQWPSAAVKNVTDFMGVIRDAADAGRSLIVIRDSHLAPGRDIEAAIREELDHEMQADLARAKGKETSEEHITYRAARRLLSTQHGAKVAARLMKIGYPAEPPVLAMEAGVRLMRAEQHAELGLSKDELKEFASEYIAAIQTGADGAAERIVGIIESSIADRVAARGGIREAKEGEEGSAPPVSPAPQRSRRRDTETRSLFGDEAAPQVARPPAAEQQGLFSSEIEAQSRSESRDDQAKSQKRQAEAILNSPLQGRFATERGSLFDNQAGLFGDEAGFATPELFGAHLIARGITKVEAWIKAMVERYGPEIRKRALAIYREAKRLAKDESGSLDLSAVRQAGEKAASTMRDAYDVALKPMGARIKDESPRLASMLQHARDVGDVMAGGFLNRLIDAKLNKLTKIEQSMLVAVLEGKMKRAPQKVVDAYRVIRNLEADVAAIAQSLDVDPAKVLSRKYDQDAARSIPHQFAAAGEKLAQMAEYGKDNAELKKILKALGDVGGNPEQVKEWVDRVFKGIDEGKTKEEKITRFIRALQTAKLGLAFIPNATQAILNVTPASDFRALWAGYKALMGAEGRRFAVESGAAIDPVLAEAHQELGLGWLTQKFMMPFRLVEQHNRIVAASAGADFAARLWKMAQTDTKKGKWAARRLADLGVDASKPFTRADILMAAKKFTDQTQFRSRPENLPAWTITPWGRVFFQFKTFSYQQARFTLDQTIGELRRGEPLRAGRNLAMFALLGGGVGELIRLLRNLLTGKEDDPEGMERVAKAMASAGALGVMLDATQAMERGKELEWLAGPGADMGINAARLGWTWINPDKDMEEKAEATKKFAYRHMPLGSVAKGIEERLQ